jgi:hypothetical protein
MVGALPSLNISIESQKSDKAIAFQSALRAVAADAPLKPPPIA